MMPIPVTVRTLEAFERMRDYHPDALSASWYPLPTDPTRGRGTVLFLSLPAARAAVARLQAVQK